MEPIVRQEYADKTGRTVEVPDRILRHPTVTFAILTADGIADGKRLYEGKTARTGEDWGEPGSAEIPQDYLLQVQHGLFVTGLEVADVAVLIGGSDFRIYEVPADAELQTMLLDREADFWRRVQSAVPPEPVDREDIKRRWRISSGAQMTVDDDALDDAIQNLSVAKAALKFVEKSVDDWQVFIQSKMRDAAELVDGAGNVLATWKNVAVNPRFDLERFKTEQPELFKRYLRDAAPQRRFLLKVKGESSCPVPLPNAPILPKLEPAPAA